MSNNKDDEIALAGIGSAHHDTVLTAEQIILGDLNPVKSDRRFGGGVYLVLEAIARLTDSKNRVLMVYPCSDDSVSRLITENAKQRNIEPVPMTVSGFQTAAGTEIHDANGLVLAVISRDIYDNVSVKNISQHIGLLKQAKAWIIDSTFSHEVLTYLAMIAAESAIDVYVIISSLASINNIKPLLGGAKALFCKADQLKQITGNYDDTEAGIKRSLEIVGSWGSETVFVNRGDKGLMAYFERKHYSFDATKSTVENGATNHGIDETLAAVIIYYLRAGKSIQDAVRAAQAAKDLRACGREKEICVKLLDQMAGVIHTQQKAKDHKPKTSLFSRNKLPQP